MARICRAYHLVNLPFSKFIIKLNSKVSTIPGNYHNNTMFRAKSAQIVIK
jgi:hypothetical protein